MDSIYLFIAGIEEVNRSLWAVMREGLHGTGLLVLDAEVQKARPNAYIKPHRRARAQLPTHTRRCSISNSLPPLFLSLPIFLFKPGRLPLSVAIKSNLEDEFAKPDALYNPTCTSTELNTQSSAGPPQKKKKKKKLNKIGLNTLSVMQKQSLFDLVCKPWLAGLIEWGRGS